MRFRLFRSRAFWFGVPGMVFLFWGWWLSMGHKSEMGRMGTSPWRLGQSAGEVYAWWDSARGLDLRNVEVWHYKLPAANARGSRNLLLWQREEKSSFRLVFIPYHWLVSAYLAGWAVLVIWRIRKFKAPAPGP